MYLQSPVGNRTDVRRILSGGRVAKSTGFSRLGVAEPLWFRSGTNALAASVAAIVQSAGRSDPLVVLPAYGCPDMVSAVRAAGAEPYFVDLEENSHCLDARSVAAALKGTEAVVAILGVDLFGLSERWHTLREIADRHAVALIQDCAQSVQPEAVMSRESLADFRIYSFGRGKPICLLGGGVALVGPCTSPELGEALRRTASAPERIDYRPSLVKVLIYNILLNPRLYAIAAGVLRGRLGATVYKPLPDIVPVHERLGAIADRALTVFWQTHADKQAVLTNALREVSSSSQRWLPDTAASSPNRNLLRLPILVQNRDTRDRLVETLVRSGIGATPMYENILPDILACAGAWHGETDFPVARRFADRLLTLPVHNRLSDRDVSAIRDALADDELSFPGAADESTESVQRR